MKLYKAKRAVEQNLNARQENKKRIIRELIFAKGMRF